MAAKEVYASSPFTMARSVTILPGALSPHSLGSVPSDWNLLGASMGDGSVSVPDGLAELGGRADSGSPEEAHERRRTRRVTFERLDDE